MGIREKGGGGGVVMVLQSQQGLSIAQAVKFASIMKLSMKRCCGLRIAKELLVTHLELRCDS